MKTISLFAGLSLLALISACGDYDKDKSTKAESTDQPASMVEDAPSYDPKRGEGKWTAENVNVGESINPEWAASGESISNTKCMSCHKSTDEKLVGPGWAGVTKRRSPEWIMNFITNPDPMIDKDPEAQAMLEICLVRMPNQNLSDAEARNILEYMRKLDGVK
jgi:mono/diheme cytochrome c family protein